MYCSTCGNQIKKGLNYCNSCGSRVADSKEEKRGSRFQSVSTAIAFIGMGCIVGFLFLVRILLEHNVPEAPMIMIILAFLATVFGISFLLIKQLSPKKETSGENIEFQNDVPKSIKSVNTNQLEEPKQQPASVVEDTTRTLEEVLIERR
jgi:F0F1-type ATP synthase assembly protein I